MSLLTIISINLSVLLALTFTLWLISLRLRDTSIIDIFWGLGFVIVAWLSASLAGWPSPRGYLLVGMTTIWGVRLAGYLAWRNWGEEEDRRYRAMRDHWGDRFGLVSLFTVFWLQAIILWVVSLPLQLGVQTVAKLNLFDAIGCFVWIAGLFFEAVGDFQLARFKSNPQNDGQVCDRGLWRYTRHPNYFGDFLVWWGYFLVAAAGGLWWTIFSPIIMAVLLMRVSGVTLLESSLTNRKPEYQSYIRRTNAFFPWFPRQRDEVQRNEV